MSALNTIENVKSGKVTNPVIIDLVKHADNLLNEKQKADLSLKIAKVRLKAFIRNTSDSEIVRELLEILK